jgi:hypothetical protein
MGADLQGRIGHDVGDVCDRIWANAVKRANAFGTALGSPKGPEPDKPSPPFGCHRLSQDNREAGGANNAPASNHE